MPRLHAFELLPDDAGREVVEGDWQALRDAGLPSQLDHKGMTNTPHVTIVAAPRLTEQHESLAAEHVLPVLPATVRVAGIAILGGSKVSLVRLVDVADEVVAAVHALRRAVPDAQHPGWLPHLTLARRLPRSRVAEALAVLGHADVELQLVSLRRWDPDAGTVHTVEQPVER